MPTNNPYNRYFMELESVIDKILTDRPDIDDFEKLDELLKMGGLSERTIRSLYRNCGFNSWSDFYDAKRGICSAEEHLKVDCVEDKLIGTLSSLKFVFKDKRKEAIA